MASNVVGTHGLNGKRGSVAMAASAAATGGHYSMGLNMVANQVANQMAGSSSGFTSEKKSSDASPPSRDTPDAFTPPNGMCSSRCSQQLTHTVPHSSAAATAWARLKFSVHTEAESPYRVWFCRQGRSALAHRNRTPYQTL
jgi:hypothetical protein